MELGLSFVENLRQSLEDNGAELASGFMVTKLNASTIYKELLG